MASSTTENGALIQENFQEFYKKWKYTQKQQLHELITAASKTSPSQQQQPQTDSSPSLCVLVDRVMAHYEEYYKTKTKCAKTEVLLLLSPPWNTPLEDAFLWVGGWRPTTAFHLLYSKSGLQFDAKFSDLVNGVVTGDLGDLSPEQIGQIDKLQRGTIKEEREITEKAAKQQDRVADREMVRLSHDASGSSTRVRQVRVDSVLKTKVEGFQVILKRADDLRLRTLKGVVGILFPIQAVHFLIAAGELQSGLHEWGKAREEKQIRSGGARKE